MKLLNNYTLSKTHPILHTLLFLMMIVVVVNGLLYLLTPIIPNTPVAWRLSTGLILMKITVDMLFYSNRRPTQIPLYPKKFTWPYVFFSEAALMVYVVALLINHNKVATGMLLIYMCALIPVYEEVLFRGLVWNWCGRVIKSKWSRMGFNWLLFAIWPVIYTMPQVFLGNYDPVIQRCLYNAALGVVMVVARQRFDNLFVPVVLHGLVNAALL